MIELAVLAGFVASTIASHGISKGVDWVTEKSKTDFQTHLTLVISKTIEEYSKANPIAETNGKYPFYHSQILLEELLKHRFFSETGYQANNENILSELSKNSQVIIPEENEIPAFLELFWENIKVDKKLNKLAVEENYKVEIFTISSLLIKILKIIENGNDKPTPKELTAIVKIKKTDIVGRGEDLQKLRTSLLENNETALINGMGGIGKTTLAAVYVDEFYNEYDHIVWLTIENSLEEAIIANSLLIRNMKLEDVDPKKQVDVCLNELSNLQSDKPKLFVIDNAHENLTEHYNKLPQTHGWHLLVTSRDRIANFKIMDLDFLPEGDAVELYKKYHNSFSDEEILEIVKGVEYHTLTIEIFAKSAKRNKWTLETVKDALSSDLKAGVNVNHTSEIKIDRIKSYLTSIFDISKLSNNEKYLLKQFTALPNQFIGYEFLSELLQREVLEWKEDFAGTLEDLYEKGFVLKDIEVEKNKESYKMHPVLVEVLLPSLKPKFDDLKLLIDSIAKRLFFDQTKDNPIHKFKLIPLGEALLKQSYLKDNSKLTDVILSLSVVYKYFGSFKKAKELLIRRLTSMQDKHGIKTVDVIWIKSSLGNVYLELGEFYNARDILEEALSDSIELFGKKSPNHSTIESNLGNVYLELEELERAKVLLERSLETDLLILGDKHPLLATRLSNLGNVYNRLENYKKAKEVLEKALEIDLENHDENHPSVATCRSNLGEVYKNLGELVKAKDLFELALNSNLATLSHSHPKVAIRQANLALVLLEMEEFEEAKNLLDIALKSGIEHFTESHPTVALRQTNLACVNASLGNIDEAVKLWKKSYDTFYTLLGKEHPKTKLTKKFLDDYDEDQSNQPTNRKARRLQNKKKRK